MSQFLSSAINYMIFKRHIERKMLMLREDSPPKRQILTFDQFDQKRTQQRYNGAAMSEVHNSGFSEAFVLPVQGSQATKRMKMQSFGCNGGGSYPVVPILDIDEDMFQCTLPPLPPIDASQFSLFNDSPPMDLDKSGSSSEDESESNSSFCRWFLNICESMKQETPLESVLQGSVFAEVSGEQMVVKTCVRRTEIPLSSSWAIVHFLCVSPLVRIVSVSSKHIVKAILQSCQTVLKISDADVPRLLSFLCEQVFIDLQLAYSLLDPGHQMKSLGDLRSLASERAPVPGANDSEDVLDLADVVLAKLESLDCGIAYREIVCPANVVLAALEYGGIGIDIDLWDQIKAQLEGSLSSLEGQARALEPSIASLNSHLGLREAIYCKLRLHENISEAEQRRLGIEHLIRSRSTNELVLSRLAAFHSLPGVMVQYRKASKTKAVYIDSFSSLMDRGGGRIRGAWDQASSVTGRIYCSRPNLQALPADHDHRDLGADVRAMFLAPPNHSYVSADFCQIELRLLAHVARDPALVAMFRDSDEARGDVFDVLAATLGISGGGLERRQTTKKAVYGRLYGLGHRHLGEALSLSPEEAAALLARVDACLPSLHGFAARCWETATATGRLATITGRRRPFLVAEASACGGRAELERQMASYVVQGSAADVCKAAMVACVRAVGRAGLDARLVLTRHDELLWLARDGDLAALLGLLGRHMAVSRVPGSGGAVPLAVPMRIKVKMGASLAHMRPCSR